MSTGNLCIRESCEDGVRTLIFETPESLWKTIFCLAERSSEHQEHAVVPVRIVQTQASDHGRLTQNVVDDAKRHTKNLRRKIAILDSLELSPIVFSDYFGAGRLFVWGPAEADIYESWSVAERVLSSLPSVIECRIVSQLDYDQRKMHPDLGAEFESIDFKTKHYPSAVATVTVFEALLNGCGIDIEQSHWGVRGVGDLGGRILDLLCKRGAPRIVVYDRKPARLEEAVGKPGVEVADLQGLLDADVDIQLTAADSGTLDVSVAERFGAKERLVGFGGPEAGLDHCSESLRVLTRARKHFVPSVLCGSMGLVSNLEEVLGHDSDLPAQQKRLRTLTDEVLRYGKEQGILFHEALHSYLDHRGKLIDFG